MVFHQTCIQIGAETLCQKNLIHFGIVLNFSSGYHHAANQAECAVRTVKDLMKRCDSAGVHRRIALLKFLCTPGPDGESPSSLMGRQFRGILPMIDKVVNNIYSAKFSDRKDKEKEKFDTRHSRKLKPLLVDSTMSCLNSDLKTWNAGVVVVHSPDNRSCHVRTESGTVISHNTVHLRLTNVNFALQQLVHQNFPEKVFSAVEKIVSQPVPNTNKSTKPKTVTANKSSTVGFDAGSNNNCYKTRSGCEVRKRPRYG